MEVSLTPIMNEPLFIIKIRHEKELALRQMDMMQDKIENYFHHPRYEALTERYHYLIGIENNYMRHKKLWQGCFLIPVYDISNMTSVIVWLNDK